MIMRWPLDRELAKIESKSGWPKWAFWEVEDLSIFLKEDFIMCCFVYALGKVKGFNYKRNGIELYRDRLVVGLYN